MGTGKLGNNGKEGFEMPPIECLQELSLSKFVANNKKTIRRIAPLNPSIAKDDEWRDPSYDSYDREYGKISKK